jgi:hypothetical protein
VHSAIDASLPPLEASLPPPPSPPLEDPPEEDVLEEEEVEEDEDVGVASESEPHAAITETKVASATVERRMPAW